jgi:hypothetical protein
VLGEATPRLRLLPVIGTNGAPLATPGLGLRNVNADSTNRVPRPPPELRHSQGAYDLQATFSWTAHPNAAPRDLKPSTNVGPCHCPGEK